VENAGNHETATASFGKLHSHKEFQLQNYSTAVSLSSLPNASAQSYNKKHKSYLPGPSMSENIVEKSSSFTTTLMPSGGDSSRLFNSLASCLITFGGRFSLVA